MESKGNEPNPEEMGVNNPEKKDISEEKEDISNQELSGFRVELPKSATFNDLIDYIKIEYGDEAASKVEEEIKWQTQQEDNLDMDSSIVDFYEKEGHSIESIEFWLPIRFS